LWNVKLFFLKFQIFGSANKNLLHQKADCNDFFYYFSDFFLQKLQLSYRVFLICFSHIILLHTRKKLVFSIQANPISLCDSKTTTKNSKCQEKQLNFKKLDFIFFLKNTSISLKKSLSRPNSIYICNFQRIFNEKLCFLWEF
jgi:hypothetical protein